MKYLSAVREGYIKDISLIRPQLDSTSEMEKSNETCISFKKKTPQKPKKPSPQELKTSPQIINFLDQNQVPEIQLKKFFSVQTQKKSLLDKKIKKVKKIIKIK